MTPELRAALRLVLEAYPPGSIAPMLREHALELLGDVPPSEGSGPAPDLTISQVAQRFGREASTVRGWVASGRLAGAYRFRGRELRIPISAVLEFEAQQRGQGPAERMAPRQRSDTQKQPDLGAWRRQAS